MVKSMSTNPEYVTLGHDAAKLVATAEKSTGLAHILQVAALVYADDAKVISLGIRKELLLKGNSQTDKEQKDAGDWDVNAVKVINGIEVAKARELSSGIKGMLRKALVIACYLAEFGAASIAIIGTGNTRQLRVAIDATYTSEAWKKLSKKEKEALPEYAVIGPKTNDKDIFMSFSALLRVAREELGIVSARETSNAPRGKGAAAATVTDETVVAEVEAMLAEDAGTLEKQDSLEALLPPIINFLSGIKPGEKGYSKETIKLIRELAISAATAAEMLEPATPAKKAA